MTPVRFCFFLLLFCFSLRSGAQVAQPGEDTIDFYAVPTPAEITSIFRMSYGDPDVFLMLPDSAGLDSLSDAQQTLLMGGYWMDIFLLAHPANKTAFFARVNMIQRLAKRLNVPLHPEFRDRLQRNSTNLDSLLAFLNEDFLTITEYWSNNEQGEKVFLLNSGVQFETLYLSARSNPLTDKRHRAFLFSSKLILDNLAAGSAGKPYYSPARELVVRLVPVLPATAQTSFEAAQHQRLLALSMEGRNLLLGRE